MPRNLRDATPKYALVIWPDEADQELPSCIELAGVEDAKVYGAVIVALEDADFCCPRARVRVDPMVLRVPPHPYRHDANWRSTDWQGPDDRYTD